MAQRLIPAIRRAYSPDPGRSERESRIAARAGDRLGRRRLITVVVAPLRIRSK
jgi:hypothetical protein